MTQDERREAEKRADEQVFDRQYQVYKEAYEQRGLSEAEANQEAAEQLETGSGERAGAHRDRD